MMNEIKELKHRIYLLNIEKGIYQAIAGTLLLLILLFEFVQ
jgi:hypothetical protein